MRHIICFVVFFASVCADAGTCQLAKNYYAGRIPPSSWDNALTFPLSGSKLKTIIGSQDGSDIVYSGKPSDIDPNVLNNDLDFMMYAPFEFKASELLLHPYMVFSAKFTNAVKNCTYTAKKLFGCKDRVYPTGFSVDMTYRNTATGENEVIFIQHFENFEEYNYGLELPSIHCNGDIEHFQIRLRDPYGYKVTTRVHEVVLDLEYKF